MGSARLLCSRSRARKAARTAAGRRMIAGPLAGLDSPGNRLVFAAGLVLVDQGRTLAVMTHPRHEIPQPGTAGGRERVACMAQIVEVHVLTPIERTANDQADIRLKLPRRSGPPITPGNTSAPGSSLTDRCSRRTG